MNNIFTIVLVSLFIVINGYSGEDSQWLSHLSSSQEKVNGILHYKWKVNSYLGENRNIFIAKWNIRSVDFSFIANTQEGKRLQNPKTGSFHYDICYTEEDDNCIPRQIMQKAKIIKLNIISKSKNCKYRNAFSVETMERPGANENHYDASYSYGKWSQITKDKVIFENIYIDSIEFDLSEIKDYIFKINN